MNTWNPNRATPAAIFALAVALVIPAATANADLVAYWNFNNQPTGSILPEDYTIPLLADVGAGEIDLSNWGGFAHIGSGSTAGGTTENALFDDAAANAFRVNAGSPTAGLPGNWTTIDFNLSMAGLQDLTMSFALRPQWSSASGSHTFDFHVWSWSVDGMNFTDAGGYEITTFGGINFWYVQEIDFFNSVPELNNAEDVTIRLLMGGANSNQFTSFDNIQIHATPIPEPGTLALVGLAALCGLRRRRVAW